jgi:hypothetical protein
MAEIKVEKKQTYWPWILLGLCILALVIYLLFFNNRQDNSVTEQRAVNTNAVDLQVNNNIIATYVSFIDSDSAKMSLDHTFTSEAILRLSDAIKAKANDIGFYLQTDFNKVRDDAVKITQHRNETTHAASIREAADILSTALQNIQQFKYPSLSDEAVDLKEASAAIDPDVLTLNQKEVIKSFFRKSADLLQKMNG